MLIVDTYNVLHVVGVLPPEMAGVDAAGLAELIAVSRYGAMPATLVCDGSPGPKAPAPGRHGSVTFRYAGGGREADDAIALMIDQSSSPRRLIVVSADHAVLRAAKRRRCRTLDSAQFLRHLVQDAAAAAAARRAGRPGGAARAGPPGAGLSAEQAEQWMKYLGVSPDEAEVGADDAGASTAGFRHAAAEKPHDAATPGGATPADAPPPSQRPPRQLRRTGPNLPRSIIEQAERLWRSEDSAEQ